VACIHLSVCSGDFITAVDGKAVTGMHDVLDAVGLEVGKTIEMKLQRGGTGAEVTVYLTTAPETSKS
jgi:S1-C subfamily serine protease